MNKNNSAVALRVDCATILFEILENGRSSRALLAEKQARYTQARDKAWLQEITFGCLRHVPTLQFWLRQLLQKPLKGNKKVIEHLLMVGLYQLAYSRVSPHAAIAETVNGCQKLQAGSLKGLVNAILREFQRAQMQRELPPSAAAQAGFPKWIFQAVNEYYPEQAEHIFAQSNAKAPLWLRVNRTQTDLAKFCRALEQASLPFSLSDMHPDAVILERYTDIPSIPGYDDGWFAVQDGAAQLAADFMQPKKGERILDCCAAPGGKTCHLLERQPTIKCTALDNDKERLARVEQNLQRLKLNAQVLCADASKPDTWWDGQFFDRILLDAPCSATGVIRRHPDIRWLRKRTDIDELVALQATILNQLWSTLKPGGVMVYATCSILPMENHRQVTAFVSNTNDAALEVERQILPGEQQMDGFYYAILLKS
ncbi:16S rRNA (cytosine(967)-C(5))-methyltransferase RsmB [Alteromonas sp. ASW11-36]|uniref:16S rRNA (cytosine(967)-C(5))-methyltransferase n=1 Tax=Alteromonas arenosi TaxID=3055817 RepID=A0ABT7ST33_9ALTE|nr:16S rRNA (cytosine(967)-C(5))-methyltransferase RsmB [Alteromonas sp. ASW11-36]MDM7859361.1 16S rRNA (cytosine(967)-C(5))-methyltransferase RsmB [Alteromonas sp. ASW11-36]